MKAQTNLVRRGAIYYLRVRVPADLLASYKKLEIVKSLKTSNQQEAIQKLRIERLILDQDFANLRGMSLLNAQNELSYTEIKRLVLLWEAKEIESIQNYKSIPIKDKFRNTQELVDEVLYEHGILLTKDSKSYGALCHEFQISVSRISGLVKHTHSPEIIRTNPPRLKEYSLNQLLKYWESQGKKAPRTVSEAFTVVKRFNAFTLSKNASEISKSDVIKFKDFLLSDNNAAATVTKKLNLLKAIFQVALDNEMLASNPARGVKAPKSDAVSKPRIPFSASELNQIFNSSIYIEGERPSAGAGEAAYWIPLLALWTGARLEELGQLLIKDICYESGVHFIHITNDENKRIKTFSSRRRVPIHPELIRIGFLRFVEQTKNSKHERLFPKITAAEGRQKTAVFSQWFSRHLRNTLNIKDSRKVFHSFRHGFKDACRNAGISIEHHDRLTGHARSNIGDGYGAEYYPLKPLDEAMSMIIYPELNLSHLYRNAHNLKLNKTDFEI